MALAESRPVDVCLETIYALDSGVFLSTLLHMPYPDRGVVWRSIQSVFTHLFTPLIACFSFPQDMCICMSARHRSMYCFPPPEGKRIDYEGALSRRSHALTYGPAWTSTSVHILLSARDTVCPICCDVEILMAPGGKPSCLTTLPAVRHCQSQCEPADSQTHLQSDGEGLPGKLVV